MSTPTNAKITAAEEGCQKVMAAWTDANTILAAMVSVNGHGIFHDPSELRGKLLSAQSGIQKAINRLDEIEWPSSTDYNQ